MRDLAGASFVINGASSGIGRAAALAFARRGAQGTGVSEGLRERKGVPSARRLNRIGLVMAGAAAILLGTTTAAYGRSFGHRHGR